MKFLLDTNICIYIIKKNPPAVTARFNELQSGDLAVSNITVSKLYYGAFKSSRVKENLIALEEFLIPLHILDFQKKDALTYGKIRAELEADGRLIGAMDMLIAAQAMSSDLTLVTNNEKEFNRVKGLRIENWV